ncbi:putative hydrolase [Frankia canadensis]|uniref:Putative hydrolase n=1 Tax=Frankia canadensis TaxID=1836972 RepID=A0A2I2KXF9_9ACTN|nr:alpha/beta hydrolase [Frankia canadensis]SNQ50347.1 putative hydrolase [Frankia canadensis]SOU57637.1 putative hydrolase [Frankia canadensis]
MTRYEDDEFALLRENADEAGIPWGGQPTVRRVSTDVGGGQKASALLWGDEPPKVVFLHGGAQNAHTWDTVILALGLPALAVDLPGHGHSDWRADRDYMAWRAAEAVDPVLRAWAPVADAVVGMSLGGLTTIRLTAIAPDLVRRGVIVDVTPSVGLRQPSMTRAERGTTALVEGPASFATFEEIVKLTAAAAPHRPLSNIRRGVLHNTRRRPDGRWEWRYDRLSGGDGFATLWEDVSAAKVPLTLVRGGASIFTADEDAEEFVRRSPSAQVHVVPGAGHSVQSDSPLPLAAIIREALARS